jgi:hypothetical protein
MAAMSPDSAGDTRRWMFSIDGALFGTFNRQGGKRGETQFRSQNWLMLMGSRQTDAGTVTLAGMITAEPLTVGLAGYSEIFQEGEAYNHLQITDRQHPHDLIMQLSAAWRIPLGDRSSVTVAGGPVGEATLGPVAFMHRASSADNPTAPLSHHIFDSTHLSTEVVMTRFDWRALSVEIAEPGCHRHRRQLREDALGHVDVGHGQALHERGGPHADRFRDTSHGQTDPDPDRDVRADGDVLGPDIEEGGGHDDVVDVRRDVQEDERALVVGGRAFNVPGQLVVKFDDGLGNDSSGLIDDDTLQRSGCPDRLGGRCGRGKHE